MPDDLDARLVVLPAESPYSKENGSPAEKAAQGSWNRAAGGDPAAGGGQHGGGHDTVTENSRTLGFQTFEFEKE